MKYVIKHKYSILIFNNLANVTTKARKKTKKNMAFGEQRI